MIERTFQVMIVEDSETQALKLRLLLEQEGYEVCTAATAEFALTKLAQVLPDLIVIDYYLPGMLGDELCRSVRMNFNTRGIPILMLTEADAHADETRGLESGADDYVSKSASPDMLLLRIRGLLRKEPTQTNILTHRDSDFRRARLLAIDDSPTHLEFLTAELRSQGYEVENAPSGPEGLIRMATQNFDCVLVDLVMPGMDGVEVCRRIAAMPQSKENAAALIILTASENKADVTRGFDAGADDFVNKSSDMAILRARIQALLRRKFFQEENRRIVEELKIKEMETVRARAELEAAEVRAELAEELVHANQEIQAANRKLKETQTQLIQTEKMASLGQLVAGIAHEVNNPLAFVLNHLFIVETGLVSISPEMEPHLSEGSLKKLRKVSLRLAEMKDGLNRVKEMVLQLRTFSRLDEGEFKTIDIGESIDSVLLFLKHKMNGRVELKKQYGPVRTLYCCGGRLNQVFMNLIANAADSIEGKGKIVITTDQVDGVFMISIKDTGTGIPEAIRSRIFDPFFTTKPIGQGTGLGLAISYGIVQDHLGSIEVQSQEGVGSEFSIKIPWDLQSRIHRP